MPDLMCSVLINEIPSQNFQMVPGQNSNGNEKCFQIEVFKALDFEEQTTYLLEIVLSVSGFFMIKLNQQRYLLQSSKKKTKCCLMNHRRKKKHRRQVGPVFKKN